MLASTRKMNELPRMMQKMPPVEVVEEGAGVDPEEGDAEEAT